MQVDVNAIPSSYIQPSGTLEVTENGTHDVKNYASVNVNVAGSGGGGSVETCTVTLSNSMCGFSVIKYSSYDNGAISYCDSYLDDKPDNVTIDNVVCGTIMSVTANDPCDQFGEWMFDGGYDCEIVGSDSYSIYVSIGSNTSGYDIDIYY